MQGLLGGIGAAVAAAKVMALDEDGITTVIGLPPTRRAGEAQPTRTSRIKPAVNCALPIRTQRPSGYSLKAGLSRSARGSTRSARISPQALNLKNGGQTQRREERKGKYLETILTGLVIFIFALKLVLSLRTWRLGVESAFFEVNSSSPRSAPPRHSAFRHVQLEAGGAPAVGRYHRSGNDARFVRRQEHGDGRHVL